MTVINEPSRALTESLIGCAIAVHDAVGPGFLEAVYQRCFELELIARGFVYVRERVIPLVYRGVRIDATYRFDFLVQDSVIIEIKSVESFAPIHRAQVINYLKLTGAGVGLLMNFNVRSMKAGIRRLEHPDLYRRSLLARASQLRREQ